MKFISRKGNVAELDSGPRKIIGESGLFDAQWYLATYPDVAAAGQDPLDHYLNHGANEGRNPGPNFDTIWYLAENYEVRAAGVNPLLHYITYGRQSETNPLPLNEGQRFESFVRSMRGGLLEGATLANRFEAVHFKLDPPPPRPELPLPPVELSLRIGSPTLESYEIIGREAKTTIMRCLPPDFSFEGARCLDFGCGIGRVIRHFAKEAEVGEFWGCDIDGTSMLWNTENLAPPFRFFQLSDFPTIPLESSSFDLVYALGVFSQLFQDWSALAMEIRRVLKPGGVFFLSFNGQISFEEQFRRPYRSFFADTGLFVSHPFRAWNKGGPAVAMSPDWIKTHWGAMFEIDYIAMEGFGDYQSFAVMRKPALGPSRKSQAAVLRLGVSQDFNDNAVGGIASRLNASLPYRESYGIEGAGVIDVKGWIVFKEDLPDRLTVAIDNETIDAAATFTPDEDNYRDWGAPRADFKFPLDLRSAAKGAHTLTATLVSKRGLRHAMSIPLFVK